MTRVENPSGRLLIDWRVLWSPEASPRWTRDVPEDLPPEWRRDWLAGQRLGIWLQGASCAAAVTGLGAYLGHAASPQSDAEGRGDSRSTDSVQSGSVLSSSGALASGQIDSQAPLRPGEPWIFEGLGESATQTADPRVATIGDGSIPVVTLADPGAYWSLAPNEARLVFEPPAERASRRAVGRFWRLGTPAGAMAVRIDEPPPDWMAWRALIEALAVMAEAGPGAVPVTRCLIGVDLPLASLEQIATLIDLLGHARA